MSEFTFIKELSRKCDRSHVQCYRKINKVKSYFIVSSVLWKSDESKLNRSDVKCLTLKSVQRNGNDNAKFYVVLLIEVM